MIYIFVFIFHFAASYKEKTIYILFGPNACLLTFPALSLNSVRYW